MIWKAEAEIETRPQLGGSFSFLIWFDTFEKKTWFVLNLTKWEQFWRRLARFCVGQVMQTKWKTQEWIEPSRGRRWTVKTVLHHFRFLFLKNCTNFPPTRNQAKIPIPVHSIIKGTSIIHTRKQCTNLIWNFHNFFSQYWIMCLSKTPMKDWKKVSVTMWSKRAGAKVLRILPCSLPMPTSYTSCRRTLTPICVYCKPYFCL